MALPRPNLAFSKSAFFEPSLNRAVLPDIAIGKSPDEKTYIGIQKLIRFKNANNNPKTIYYICHQSKTLLKARNAYEQNPQAQQITMSNVFFYQLQDLLPKDLAKCDFMVVDDVDHLPIQTINFLWNLAINNNIVFSEPTDPERRTHIYNLVLPAKLKNAQSPPQEKLPPLHYMAQFYKSPEQRSDIEKGIALLGDNINWAPCDNVSALYVACTFNNIQAVELLLNHPNINVNIKLSTHNETPLHVASEKGHHKIAEMLLQHGADLYAKLNDNETTAFNFALHYSHINLLKMLHIHKAKLEDPNDSTDPFLLILPHCFARPHILYKECATSPVFLNDLIQQLKKNNILLDKNNLSDSPVEAIIALILYLIFAMALKPKNLVTLTVNKELLDNIQMKFNIPLIRNAIVDYFDPKKLSKGLQPLALFVNQLFTEVLKPENTPAHKR